MSAISKELAALDAVIEGATALANEALNRKADLKQGKLASETYGRINTAVKVRLESRLNQGKLIEIEAKLVNGGERSGSGEDAGSGRALGGKGKRQLAAA
jgi:hypothetical protein